jgi:hypothetical protein
MYSAAIMKNQPSHHARFAPEITAGVIAGRTTCLVWRHPVSPKLLEDSATFEGIALTAPITPKKIAQAIEVKSKIMTEDSIPSGPKANRKPITMGKYPKMGIDCKRSMKGVRMREAILFVAASIPKVTPQRTESANVIAMRAMVLNVYNGRFLTASVSSVLGYGTKLIISHARMQRATSPITNRARYPLKAHSPA